MKESNFSWKDNPKYNLWLHSSTKKTLVKITISRPEKVWKKQIAESSVDCMMGLYIWSLDESRTPNLKSIMNSMKFVPFNSLTEVSQITLANWVR